MARLWRREDGMLWCVLLACLWTVAVCQRAGTTRDNLILTNAGIKVPFGRSVFLDPARDLRIRVVPGDRCIVTVLQNDPLSQRPGRLMPNSFPCDFGQNEVQYSHFGARSPSQDHIRLQLRYDSQTETIIVPFVIEVEVQFIQLEIVTRNVPLNVPTVMGTSGPIDRSVIQFSYDRGNQVCRVTVLSSNGGRGLPRYGVIENNINGSMIDCDQFLQANIRYRHTSKTNSPNRDYIPMVAELTDTEGNLLKREYFQVMVRVRDGEDNTAPQPSFASMFILEVNQFVMTAITPDILAAEDLETDADELIFNITGPLGVDEGEIVSTDDRNLPLSSFYQRDIRDLKIAYKPPAIDSNQQRIFQVEFEVVDAEGLTSDPFNLMIVVNPMNTLAPIVTRNTGQLLYEGQSRPLLSSLNLEISDEDNLRDVTVSPIAGLRHGELLIRGQRRKFFTVAELDAGVVVYSHDGSDTYSDNIIFRMTDGDSDVEFLFPIYIIPTDDEPPILNANTGLTINKGQTVEISAWVLSATDIDSDDSSIKFTLETPYSSQGEIVLRQFEVPEDPENWRFLDDLGLYEKTVTEWTQEDLYEGRVYYRHIGAHSTSVVMDFIEFRVSDNNDPPNLSRVYSFIVKIMPVDDIAPTLYEGTTLQMTVDEFELTSFRKKFLRYTDLDSDDRDLKYTIILQPYDIDEELDGGQIVLFEEPDVAVTMFTQAQVNHHKIGYKPPDVELGLTPRVIQFVFSVQDTSGNSVDGQRFTIFLRPVDNKPPVLTNEGLTVFERGTVVLTPDDLDASDVDTDPSQIYFEVTKMPQHGTLQYDTLDMTEGSIFTLDDIAGGYVAYIHGGGENEDDSFKLTVSDGVHEETFEVSLRVRPIDDELPELDLPPGSLGTFIEVMENGATTITPEILRATDPDTDELMLTFIITDRPPQKGIIVVDGIPTDRFTQQNILNGLVQYVHTSGEIGTEKQEDMFNLTLSDMSDEWIVGGNNIEQVQIFVTILPVDSIPPNVTVGEQYVVDEAGKATITLAHLSATDPDTEDDDIMCTIIVQPMEGFVENISPAPGSEKSRAGKQITSFTIGDIRKNHIKYVQSVHKKVEPVEDRFTLRCTDGFNFSPNYFFPIVIVPSNDEVPEVFMREFIVMEGMNLAIDLPILSAVDLDIPADELHFYVTKPPEHGVIVQQRPTGTIPVLNFTMDQVKEGSNIKYEHDDTETKEDSFDLRLTDGVHDIEKTILVMVIPVDDETPRLMTNTGVDIEIGETKIIDNNILKATDLDSEDKNLTFIVRFGPQHGFLQRVINGFVVSNITVGMNFTQREIDEKHIQYMHIGQEGVRDLIKFDVTDGFNPLIDRYFYVTVDSIDMLHPGIINKGVTLKEGGLVKLTTDLLSTSDLNSDDENLQFTITNAPLRGHLENTDFPGIPITTFTQLELAGNKVYYIHTSEEEIKMDSFEFEVTDGFNPVFRTFRISISDVDNKKPVVTFRDIRVREAGNKYITPFELMMEDRDTPDNKLTFTITQVPVNGNLLYNKSKIVNKFTMADLNENLITYQHDGSETTSDSFSFTVTDGTHMDYFVYPDTEHETRKPVTMKIQILAVDNGIPQIVVNKGAPTIAELETGHLGFRFTPKYLKAEDRDSNDKTLRYFITTQPEFGRIINVKEGNNSISDFTQGQIDDMLIHYIIHDNVNATSDSFVFKVQDNGGNALPNQVFRLNWCWISVEKDQYTVDENTKYLVVNLNRRGYLGETAFVTINTEDGTAEKGEDFTSRANRQVQFNPGQTSGKLKIRIMKDDTFERSETFTIVLSEPFMGVLEYPDRAVVEITDGSDESTVYIPDEKYVVEEDIGELLIPIKRKGDISKELMVVCSTKPDTATGTTPTTVLSYSDYISRPEDHNSVIRFDQGEDEKPCRIVIIDDSLYEEQETFQVVLSMPMGGRIGEEFSSTEVVIAPDDDDEPVFYFSEEEYRVDESDGYVEVQVWRTGTDLTKTASVTVRSRKTSQQSAESGQDYVGISKNLDFPPGVTMQTVRITILDDLGQPVLEGPETFDLVLRMPMNAALGEPSRTTVVINDSVSDLPMMSFAQPVYDAEESDGQVTVMVVRTGDVSHASTVRCYTRQHTAQVMMDYDERPNTDDSIITFEAGEKEKPCVVVLVNDTDYEEEEQFRLVLGSPSSDSALAASIGAQNETLIKVHDEEDKPIIKLGQVKFTVNEPKFDDEYAIVEIPVIRTGDTSKTSIVRVHTKDGSAKSGLDYLPLSMEVKFGKNVTKRIVEVEVLYDGEREIRESFTVLLKNDRNMIAETRDKKAIIYIEEMNRMADVTFPLPPQVVSLMDYDDMVDARDKPPAGYPVVCVTACNPKFTDYDKTGSLCTTENINETLTRYRWRVSAPSGQDGVTNRLRDVESTTYFTSTREITLDSIYFGPNSRVQCVARAVNSDGDPGLESTSEPVTISSTEGLCQQRVAGTIGADPFTAKMRYTGAEDPDHPNLIRLSVTMPHIDGMLPVISTQELANFEITLSQDGTRIGLHKCSNLLDFDEVDTRYGFITDETKNPNIVGETQPYQYSSDLRGEKALRFYRNLDLESCLWEFVSYYDMSELLTECGGQIGTDGQVLNLVQSYVTLRVPLYVSYIFHSPAAVGGWQHFDLQSQLRLTFVYDTAILWQDGISAPPEAQLQGYLYPTGMRINGDGRLVVNFRTEARFRGQFVLDHPGSQLTSMVMSGENDRLTFTLENIRSQTTFNQPDQEWEFISDYAVRDYSGTYQIKLVPCTTTTDQTYSLPIVCTPREPVTFDMDVRFQQVSDPVATEFSLNTQFHLLAKRSLWLSDGSMGFGEGSDTAFAAGDTMFGRIMVDPVQNLGDSFFLTIEKVYLCTGIEGYVPKYSPDEGEYGCVAESPKLLHTMKVLDKGAPNTVVEEWSSVPFNAVLAIDDPSAATLTNQAGSDGFRMDATPLFQVSSGRTWFIHAIYTVRSEENRNRGLRKRSITFHSIAAANEDSSDILLPRYRRSGTLPPEEVEQIGKNGMGTNLHRVMLNFTATGRYNEPDDQIDIGPGDGNYDMAPNEKENMIPYIPIAAVICAVALLACCIFAVCAFRRRKKRTETKTVTTVYNTPSQSTDASEV
ncbi:FRAS1-related extracellular matrix protein 2-like [Branchiostoma floridae x Branchiostoma belcheri]